MAIGLQISGSGWTTEQLDRLSEVVQSEGTPDGLLFHAVWPTGDGAEGMDFWVSRDHFDRFASEKLGPAAAAAGLAPPDVREFALHDYFPR
ncbi:MAG TPA: hypothetical protein VK283_03630 [Acidimicrobiales bacterium]|nr:hypothetical protein [Acidimicrobiales bacterium]